eukprot:12865081-Alexandrium_andersonii.AAC.1
MEIEEEEEDEPEEVQEKPKSLKRKALGDKQRSEVPPADAPGKKQKASGGKSTVPATSIGAKTKAAAMAAVAKASGGGKGKKTPKTAK